ncbi:MAG: hypothetical protein ACKVXR_07790 [Planctomycetota bacterium]
MNLRRQTLALETCLREELSGQASRCARLASMESAVRSADPSGLEEAARELLRELEAGIERARVRGRVLAQLAAALEIAPARVGAVAEALGAEGARLLLLRTELRAACADALARGRRLATLVRAHGALVEEALGRFLAPDPTGAPLGRGSLVDARA